MADTKITDLAALDPASLADGDQFVVVDVSDTTMAASGTNKKLTASGIATQAELDTHSADTTSVHGIADTSILATDSEVATAVSDHSADTTSVHGITDTAALETTTGAQAKVDAHTGDTSDAHAASAISYAGGTGMSATNVETAIDELADEKASTPGAWTSFTPTLTQNGVAVTKTVTYAKYSQFGKTVVGAVDLAVTGAGTTNTTIRCGLPVAGVSNVLITGNVQIFDASANTTFNGVSRQVTTTEFDFWSGGTSANPMGQVPNFALANGDVIRYGFTYEAA